ncbi:MAG: M28 family peptidase, partial [Thermoplasmata archaeon]
MVCGFSVASPLVAAGKKRADLLSLVIENIDMDYAYQIVEDLSSMGTATTIDGEHFGFRAAGSTASHEASMYVKDKMENYTHLVSVEADRFAVDAWEFRGAYVDVPGLGRIQAASHGGSPGTDADGITAEIVNVGNGYASDYPEDVTGKIVLANWIGYDFWVDSIAKEAELRGAAAIIVTTYDSDYGNQPGAIENHDGLYREGWPPMVSISGDDGLRIIEKLETDGPFEVTVWSDITITTMEEGGFGWNIVGYLPGKNFNWEHPSETEELLIVGDHTDAWFFGGMDDDSGIAAVLSLADAFKKAYDAIPSDKIPERSIVFVTHDAEEYGILDTYYDWCYGAWNEITAIHPEWVGNAVACLIMELMGMAGLPLDVNMSPELYGFVRNVLGQNTAKLPYGFRVTPVPHSWADHWTYAAAGVPGVEFATSNAWWDATYYHNQFDTIDTIDFGYLGQLFEVYADLILRLVTLPVIPYNLATTATNLWETLAHDEDFNVGLLYPIYEKWGFDPEANMGPTVTEAERFLTNAETLRHELRSLGKHVHPEKAKAINRLLMSITAK